MTVSDYSISLVLMVIAYLLGSIPFGLIFTRLFGLGDVRNIGSGNIGATNVLRTGNKKVAAFTLLGDLLKGTVAVLIAQWGVNFTGVSSSFVVAIAGLCAFLGHIFPIWLHFKGGKGVATFIGVVLGLQWPCAIVFAIVWIIVAYLTRYSSLAALVGVVVIALYVSVLGNYDIAIIVAIMSAITIFRHKTNIVRLMNHTESKIGDKTA